MGVCGVKLSPLFYNFIFGAAIPHRHQGTNQVVNHFQILLILYPY